MVGLGQDPRDAQTSVTRGIMLLLTCTRVSLSKGAAVNRHTTLIVAIALRRAEHPEIKQLAEDVIRTQSAEVEQIREWYRQWFGTDVPDRGDSFGMMGGMMDGMVDLEVLEKAGEFDKAFIEAMIPHHQMGIMMSRMAGSATRRPELRALTQSIVRAQSEEIDDMREWYEEWYGR